ncbi:MAG TPA: EAL domain-containing protein, partial [Steroidobacteraceae bacterium]|nr:EAL domain-containing protein [Steroidobacteraceae bacterium]
RDFELLESIGHSLSSPLVIAVTELDSKTVDSIRRLAAAKGLKVAVFKKGPDQENAIKTCLAGLRRKDERFGAEDLRDALERQYLRVQYQPKVPFDPTSSPHPYGVEALCRIHHPSFGEIRPDDFINIAEKEGLITTLTEAVVRQSFRDWHAWHDQGLTLKLAINVSPMLLKTNEWAESFLRCCSEFNMETDQITLEITESSSGATAEAAVEALTRLRLRGVTLSIDDFGTGFSSLATLYKLPFGELKIDKSFVMALKESSEARALIETTVGMAQRLGLKVTAEGVETQAVFHELRLMGCNDAQGYFISKALNASEICQFFADWLSSTERKPIQTNRPVMVPKIAIIQLMLDGILDESDNDPDGMDPDSKAALELTRKLPALALEARPIAALANCHAAGRRLEKHQERVALKAKVLELRRILEQELLCKDDIDIVTPTGSIRLLPRRSAFIGRASAATPVDIAVSCRWLSRGDKNLRLFSEGLLWMIEDLGSTNGTCIGEHVLTRGRPFALPIGETLIEIGKPTGTTAPVAIRMRRPSASPSAIVVTLVADPDHLASVGPDDLWPLWAEDLKATWIIFQESVTVGASKNCAIVLDDATSDVAAEIRFQDGFWIRPFEGAELTIADVTFDEAVPLLVAESASIPGASFQVALAQARAATAQALAPIGVSSTEAEKTKNATG